MPNDLDMLLKEAAAYQVSRFEKLAQNPLSDLVEAIPPEARSTIQNALIGGLLGGAGGGYLAGPGNRAKGILGGAGLGALTGGAGTLGMQLLGGQLKLPGERGGPDSIIGNASDAIAGFGAAHPGLALGGAAGGIGAAVKGPRIGKIEDMLQNLIATSKDKTQVNAAKNLMQRIAKIKKSPRMPYLRRAFGGANAPDISGLGDTGVLKGVMKGLKTKNVSRIKQILEAATGGGKAIAARGKNLASASRINRILQAMENLPIKRPGRLGWALAPIGLGAGYLADKYLKGEY
jgi:hypothetical protein